MSNITNVFVTLTGDKEELKEFATKLKTGQSYDTGVYPDTYYNWGYILEEGWKINLAELPSKARILSIETRKDGSLSLHFEAADSETNVLVGFSIILKHFYTKLNILFSTEGNGQTYVTNHPEENWYLDSENEKRAVETWREVIDEAKAISLNHVAYFPERALSNEELEKFVINNLENHEFRFYRYDHKEINDYYPKEKSSSILSFLCPVRIGQKIVHISWLDLMNISKQYEQMIIKEYLLENHPEILDVSDIDINLLICDIWNMKNDLLEEQDLIAEQVAMDAVLKKKLVN